MNTHDMLPYIWPLCFVLVALFVIRAIGEDAKALARWTATTVTSQGGKHAMFFAIVIGFGLQAFGTGFYDNFWPIEPPEMAKLGWWQVLAALLKSMSFAIGIMVGYALRGPQAASDAKPTPPAPSPSTNTP